MSRTGWTTFDITELTSEELQRMAERTEDSPHRPVLRLGTQEDQDHPDWSPYLDGAPTLAGIWNPKVYGVWAWFSATPKWVGPRGEGVYYLVPNEHRVVEAWDEVSDQEWRDLEAALRGISHRCRRDAETVIEADDVPLGTGWAFPGDFEDPMQRAAVNASHALQRTTYSREVLREAVREAVEPGKRPPRVVERATLDGLLRTPGLWEEEEE